MINLRPFAIFLFFFVQKILFARCSSGVISLDSRSKISDSPGVSPAVLVSTLE